MMVDNVIPFPLRNLNQKTKINTRNALLVAVL